MFGYLRVYSYRRRCFAFTFCYYVLYFCFLFDISTSLFKPISLRVILIGYYVEDKYIKLTTKAIIIRFSRCFKGSDIYNSSPNVRDLLNASDTSLYISCHVGTTTHLSSFQIFNQFGNSNRFTLQKEEIKTF